MKEIAYSKNSFNIINDLQAVDDELIKEEIITGLKNSPKYISPKFFYNSVGSQLFEDITNLEEYYPNRTEKSILNSIGSKLDIGFNNLNVVELGSGDHSKIRLLFNQIKENTLESINYFPIDISQSTIEKSSKNLLNEFPTLNITGIVTDFMHDLKIPETTGKRLICFLGSTIGNLNRNEVENFMRHLGNEMKPGDKFLLGLDMVKDSEIINRAYNDDRQITAEFNKNILNVVNDILGSNFETTNFEHIAFYNEKMQRIEMHLKANCDMNISLNNNSENILLVNGEMIHTENSYKFNLGNIEEFGIWSALEIEDIFSDDNDWFNLVLLKKRS
jgi:L-histidine N-alpha-methyltransferase